MRPAGSNWSLEDAFWGHGHGTPTSCLCGSYSSAVGTHSEVHKTTHAYIDTYTYTYMYTRGPLQTHINTHTDTHTHTWTHTQAYTYTCTHIHVHTDMHVCVHTQRYSYTYMYPENTHVQVCVRIQIYTYISQGPGSNPGSLRPVELSGKRLPSLGLVLNQGFSRAFLVPTLSGEPPSGSCLALRSLFSS